MLQLIDRKKKIFFYLILFLLLSTQITKNQYSKNDFQTNLKNIQVIGLSEENNIKVYESLEFLLKKSIFFLNKKDFLNIL